MSCKYYVLLAEFRHPMTFEAYNLCIQLYTDDMRYNIFNMFCMELVALVHPGCETPPYFAADCTNKLINFGTPF